MNLDFGQCRAELDEMFDSLRHIEVVDWHTEKSVIEIEPGNGWRNWKLGKDTYIRIHLREQSYPEEDIND